MRWEIGAIGTVSEPESSFLSFPFFFASEGLRRSVCVMELFLPTIGLAVDDTP
jgi:hypothetical protein